MTMFLVTARRHPDRVRFVVHLDTDRTVVDADTGATIPDPEWVLEQVYPFGKGERRQAGETDTDYRARISAYMANIRADMRDRCRKRLSELEDLHDPGVALAGEGQAF